MPGTKLSGRQIMQLFYTEVDRSVPVNGMDEALDVPTIFRCKCGKTRAQKLKHGYTNLVQHVLVKHSDWVTAATQEAVPIPVPTAINSAKLATVKANGKKRVQTEGKSISQVITGNNNAISNSSDNEPKAQKTVIVKQSTSAPLKVQKRSDYLSWDDYFMSVAFLSAMRSKDPSTQVGACIVNTERKIVGIGYNGFPNRCGDDELPWARVSQTNSPLDTKYPYVCHAEMNAILNKNCADVKGCTVRVFKCTMEGFMALLTREYAQIYVALFPCNECAKLIIQSGISRVVYCSDKYKLDWKFVASRRLLDMAGVQYTHHQLQRSKIVIDFTSVV